MGLFGFSDLVGQPQGCVMAWCQTTGAVSHPGGQTQTYWFGLAQRLGRLAFAFVTVERPYLRQHHCLIVHRCHGLGLVAQGVFLSVRDLFAFVHCPVL